MDRQLLLERLRYDPDTGEFYWLRPTSNRVRPGQVAGSIGVNGYIQIRLQNKDWLAHRLAWLAVYGELPEKMIDHINAIRHDNRIVNLRLADASQNAAYSRSRHKGIKGVYWNKRLNKWHAKLTHNYQQLHLGYFDSVEQAQEAVKNKRDLIFGDFAKH